MPIAEPQQLGQAFHALADGNRRAGRVRTCELEGGAMRAAEQWIAEHRATWERRFDRHRDGRPALAASLPWPERVG